MARKKYAPEEIIKLLRLVEIEMSQGKSAGQACKKLGFTEQSYYRWRKEYVGQHRIGEQCRAFGHAPCAAARAEPATLATERH